VLIPTLLLLFGADIKLAGSLSLAVSLPTMLIGFARYSRDQSFGQTASSQTARTSFFGESTIPSASSQAADLTEWGLCDTESFARATVIAP
jgi:hypothetical protein